LLHVDTFAHNKSGIAYQSKNRRSETVVNHKGIRYCMGTVGTVVLFYGGCRLNIKLAVADSGLLSACDTKEKKHCRLLIKLAHCVPRVN
jgi:hypothetical protein